MHAVLTLYIALPTCRSRYLTNPEARAKQIVSVTNKSDIRFCKAFWSITEGDVIAVRLDFHSCEEKSNCKIN